MEFVIQHNLMNEDQLRATKDAVAAYPHRFVGLIPFSREITSDEPLIGTDFIPYGSTLLTSLVHEMGWKGCSFDLRKFNYEASMRNRDDMLQHDELYYIGPIDFAIELLRTQDRDRPFFIRPSEDLKQFAGQVIEAGECADWLEDAMKCDTSGSYKLDANTVVVIANPRNIQAEWRWFVVGGEVIDGSMYRAHGQLIKQHETNQAVINEAQVLADKWLPDPCCVMDLALVDDEIKVIEFNCINSSGFYNHNVNDIFAALYEYHSR
jgi:hypothetical protein